LCDTVRSPTAPAAPEPSWSCIPRPVPPGQAITQAEYDDVEAICAQRRPSPDGRKAAGSAQASPSAIVASVRSSSGALTLGCSGTAIEADLLVGKADLRGQQYRLTV